MRLTKNQMVKDIFFLVTSGKRNLSNFTDGMWIIEVVAGDGVPDELATSVNIFISYAFDVLGDDVHKVCEEIFVENGWMNR